MPYGNFKWSKTNIDVSTVPEDADTKYILGVVFEYPEELHDFHSDLSLKPERKNHPVQRRKTTS